METCVTRTLVLTLVAVDGIGVRHIIV